MRNSGSYIGDREPQAPNRPAIMARTATSLSRVLGSIRHAVHPDSVLSHTDIAKQEGELIEQTGLSKSHRPEGGHPGAALYLVPDVPEIDATPPDAA